MTIEIGDIVIYFLGMFYVLTVLTVGDLLRRKMNYSSDFTRKVIHLFSGASIWTVPYYPHPWVAALLAGTFVVFLFVAGTDRFSRYFEAMARPEDLEHGSVRGPFWYAVTITVLTGAFTISGYEHLYFAAAASIHIMMFGDGLSAPIGMKYGTNHRRKILGSIRSLHGSLALFIFGFGGALLAFWFFGVLNYGVFVSASGVMWTEMCILSLIAATSATLIELVSPKGTDNLTVPFITTTILLIIVIGTGIVVP